MLVSRFVCSCTQSFLHKIQKSNQDSLLHLNSRKWYIIINLMMMMVIMMNMMMSSGSSSSYFSICIFVSITVMGTNQNFASHFYLSHPPSPMKMHYLGFRVRKKSQTAQWCIISWNKSISCKLQTSATWSDLRTICSDPQVRDQICECIIAPLCGAQCMNRSNFFFPFFFHRLQSVMVTENFQSSQAHHCKQQEHASKLNHTLLSSIPV